MVKIEKDFDSLFQPSMRHCYINLLEVTTVMRDFFHSGGGGLTGDQLQTEQYKVNYVPTQFNHSPFYQCTTLFYQCTTHHSTNVPTHILPMYNTLFYQCTTHHSTNVPTHILPMNVSLTIFVQCRNISSIS